MLWMANKHGCGGVVNVQRGWSLCRIIHRRLTAVVVTWNWTPVSASFDSMPSVQATSRKRRVRQKRQLLRSLPMVRRVFFWFDWEHVAVSAICDACTLLTVSVAGVGGPTWREYSCEWMKNGPFLLSLCCRWLGYRKDICIVINTGFL